MCMEVKAPNIEKEKGKEGLKVLLQIRICGGAGGSLEEKSKNYTKAEAERQVLFCGRGGEIHGGNC